MKTSALPLQTLSSVSEAIRQRQVSPVEVVNACLDRIERLQPQLNAFITVTADAALQAAAAAEKEIGQGRWKGPLHGIPVGIKDFYDTAGLKTTAAFEPFKERRPRNDAAGVQKLRTAGAIVIGKTNMHTLGMGTTGLESYFGAVRNPWNADYIPGGSSSGSAAAVAAGMCFATLDTDAIGSCRLPAACCGVVGYKGSYGAIDMTGILEGEQPPDDMIRWLSHAGLTTRSIRDTVLMLDVLAPQRDEATMRDVLAGKSSLRIGVADNLRVDADVASVFDRAVGTIRGLEHEMRHSAAPLVDFSKGLAMIETDRRTIGSQVFKDIDLLLLPTTTTVTPSVKAATGNPQALSPELTMFANYYGLPAVSVPGGFDSRGLPVGLQMVAGPGDDALVLRLAAEYEAVSRFSEKHPAM